MFTIQIKTSQPETKKLWKKFLKKNKSESFEYALQKAIKDFLKQQEENQKKITN